MYNIDYSIAAIVLLAILLVHYLRHQGRDDSDIKFFPCYTTYMIALAVLDIVDVVLLRMPSVPIIACTIVCALYLAGECIAIAGLTFLLPALIMDATEQERRRWRFLLTPALIISGIVLFVSVPTGVVFSIGPNRLYVTGPIHELMFAGDMFYLVVIVAISLRNRDRVDRERLRTLIVLTIMGACGFLLQKVFWDIRLTVFVLALLTLEAYFGFLAPESRYDHLTKLLGRRGFYEEAERILQGSDGDFVLIYVNIREFKAMNDLYGVKAGDQILATIGKKLTEGTRGKGVAGRLQGDHFAVCIDTDKMSLEDIYRRTTPDAIKDALGYDLRFVFGLYRVEDRNVPVSTMCDCARIAMHTVEDDQTERYVFYHEDMRARFLSEHELCVAMKGALDDGQFEVYLQPLLDSRFCEPVAAEALVRWNQPGRGMVPPGEFITVFERNGLIAELDHFVWRTVCEQLKCWADAGYELLPISVNASAVDIRPGFGRSLKGLVEEVGVDPRYLRIEITESAYAPYHQQISQLIRYLRTHGFTTMMDDFGTGYSSLATLKNAFFDQVKMDQTFLEGMEVDTRSFDVVMSTVQLVSELGMTVVAEGIETESQANILRDMGVDLYQGYLFGRPMPISEFESRYMKRGNA